MVGRTGGGCKGVVGNDFFPVGGGNTHDIQFSGFKGGDGGGIVRNQFEVQCFDGGFSSPVTGVSFQCYAHIRDSLCHGIGSGTAGVKAKKTLGILIFFREFLVDDADGSNFFHEGRKLIFQMDFYRRIVRSGYRIDGFHFFLHIGVVKASFIGINHIACLHGFSVLESNAVTQLKGPGKAVFAHGIFRCQHGNFFCAVIEPVERLVNLAAQHHICIQG